MKQGPDSYDSKFPQAAYKIFTPILFYSSY